MFDLDIGTILLGLAEDQTAAARSAALRNKPPPMPKPPPGPPQAGGASGGWDTSQATGSWAPDAGGATGSWGSPEPPGGATGAWGPPQQPPMPPPPPMPQPQAQPPRQGPILPQAVAQAQPALPAPPGAANAVDPEYASLIARQQELTRQFEGALAPPDMAAAQEAYGKRANAGGKHLLLALAAQAAGEGYQPVQAHFLKQAAASREPMKVHGGTMTETGFIEDPGYRQDLVLKKLQAQMAMNDRIIEGNNTRRAKEEAEGRNERLRLEMQRNQIAATAAQAGQASADRRYAADLAHQDRVSGQAIQANKAGKGTPAQEAAEGALRLKLLKEAELHLDNATSSGLGRLVDKGAAFFGQSTTGSQGTSALQTISGQLVASMPKMSGPQSDKDVELYKQMAGKLDDPNVPREDKKAALAQIRRLNAQYADTQPAAPPPPAGAAPAAPAAAGRTATGPKGEKLKLVGNKWVPA